MSTLRSALDELRIRDLRDLSDDELVSHLDELEHVDRFLDADAPEQSANSNVGTCGAEMGICL